MTYLPGIAFHGSGAGRAKEDIGGAMRRELRTDRRADDGVVLNRHARIILNVRANAERLGIIVIVTGRCGEGGVTADFQTSS